MLSERNLKDFIKKYNLEATEEELNGIWPTLLEIADDYYTKFNLLNIEANYIASKLQNIEHVHSVRWRIKSTDHLIKKIIRKKKENNAKYQNINCTNYLKIINDSIGLRALHLFKDEGIEIINNLNKFGKPAEKPVAYIRSGDAGDQIEKYKRAKLKTEIHKSGYRSIHFILPITCEIETFCEIQVRTIFEEGWGEIDHKLRYPDYSDDQIVFSYLLLLNRLAGSADEMGSLAKEIKNHLNEKRIEKENLEEEVARLKSRIDNKNNVTNHDLDNLLKMVSNINKSTNLNNDALRNYYNIMKHLRK